MQAGTSRFWAILFTLAMAAAMAEPAAAQISDPEVGPKRLITHGAWNKSVNETALSDTRGSGVPVIAMWQQQNPPGAGQTEDPIRIDYAVGEYDVDTNTLTWTLPPFTDVFPTPFGYSRMRSPMVVMTEDISVAYHAGGAALLSTGTNDEAFVTSSITRG